MRSLWYLLTRRPVNLDDHLDFLADRVIEKVTLRLEIQTFVSDFVVANHLVSHIRLHTESGTYTVEMLCGGYLESDSQNRKLLELNRANRKIDACLKKLRAENIPVEDSGMYLNWGWGGHADRIAS